MDTRRYKEFDEFAANVSSFDGRILLNHPNTPEWSITKVDLGSVYVQMSLVGSGTIVEGESWDGYMVYLPLSGACRKVLNGVEISKDAMVVFEPGCDIHLVSTEEHSWSSLFVPITEWSRAGFSPKLSLRGEKGAARVTRPNPQLMMQGVSMVRDIRFAVANYPQFETTGAAKEAAAVALKFVSRVVQEKDIAVLPETGRPRISRQEIIHRCSELLEEREGERVSVCELSVAAGVSQRTLETAFHECYDESPTRYLQLRRLQHIHAHLRTADPDEQTVTKILADHGEWEFGRFAGYYRKVYGELPSETLHAH